MRTSRVPVLVVGAGPAGSMVTLELARRGVHVRVVDLLPRPLQTARGISLHAPTLEVFDRIDRRLLDRFLERGLRVHGCVIHHVDAAGRRRVEHEVLEPATGTRYPFELTHRQSETELYLREYTSAHYGASPDWGVECVGFEQDDDGVVATLLSEGVEERVHCQYLVACDGPNSSVRRVAGMAPQYDAASATVLHTLDAYLDGFPEDTAVVHRCVGDGEALRILAVPGGFYRLERSEARAAPLVAGRLPEYFMRLVARHFDRVSLREVISAVSWQRRGPSSRVYRERRVLWVGDAACDRFGSGEQGLEGALQDGYNLGWKLAFVVKGSARSALLDTYALERRGTDESAWATGSAGGASLAVGGLVRDVDLGYGKTLFDALHHASYTLLAFAPTEEGAGSLRKALKPLAERFAPVLRLQVIGPSAVLRASDAFGPAETFLLVRPDGRVGWVSPAAEVAALEAQLTDWLMQ